MLRESEFIQQLRNLVGTPVHGLDERAKADVVRRLAAQLLANNGESPAAIECVPFVTGRRPIDEASFPGLGSSDNAALIVDDASADDNHAYLLYRLTHIQPGEDMNRYEVRVTLSLAGPWGDAPGDPLPDWRERAVPPLAFECAGGTPRLVEVPMAAARERCLAIAISPSRDLAATDGRFGFANLFMQQVRAEIVLLRDGVPVSACQSTIDACDARRAGSLYRRILEQVIARDVDAQARQHRSAALERACHPWFPVLLIGSDKAALYMQALAKDIVHKQRHLTDPAWLLRLGVYLELLTCLGIAEAVRADAGDILTTEERDAYETSAVFAPIRKAVDVERWKRVWRLRAIAMPQVGVPRAGSVSALNLLAKKKATLAFIEAHHEDLKQAIRLAGPNGHNAQETWHRVFRDAERAVLRNTPAAFPEVRCFPAMAQEFILWHQAGKVAGLDMPVIASWFGDQDGLFASACNQYRASMNHVASWAKAEGLMDYAGSECIPESVSILKAAMNGQRVRLAQLQRRDGYNQTFNIAPEVPPPQAASREAVVSLFRSVPMFRALNDDEIESLAATARPIELGPVERIIVEGREGTSLFVVAAGNLEVMVRQKDGVDSPVAILEPGSVFGEMSLLTGQRRSATVRSIDSALVYEVGQQQLAPILQARPDAVNELAAIMEPRVRATVIMKHGYEAKKKIVSLGRKIRSFFMELV